MFALLLSCPTFNQDESYFFNKAKDPFVAPQALSDVGDIHTDCYDALIKKAGIDMLLSCIKAMDKTNIDMVGRLQMEPITISQRFLNQHIMRRLPSALRILGYINHSNPVNLLSDAEIDPKFNAHTDLPNDVHRVKDPLGCPNVDVSWATLLLNETHMQKIAIMHLVSHTCCKSKLTSHQTHSLSHCLLFLAVVHCIPHATAG